MAKYSFDFKLKVVLEYLNGQGGYGTLARKHGILAESNIQKWVKMYQQYGEDGLKRSRKNSSYDIEFKLEAITLYETSEMSYADVAIHLGLNNPSLVANWRRKYNKEGFKGLSKKQGRPPMKENKDKSLDKKKSTNNKTLLDDKDIRIKELEQENRMLLIKNKYLEQLRSLRLQEATKKKQESSTNSEKNTD